MSAVRIDVGLGFQSVESRAFLPQSHVDKPIPKGKLQISPFKFLI